MTAAPQTVTALGLISGTSMDAIDMAMIGTDGTVVTLYGPTGAASYGEATRALLQECIEKSAAMPAGGVTDEVRALWTRADTAVTAAHQVAIEGFAKKNPDAWAQIEVIGYHGQTVLHRPQERLTVQLGDGAALAQALGKPVIGQFRLNDVKAGGEGAPFAPLYHRALVETLRAQKGPTGPVGVLNLGGVGNVTWIGEPSSDEAILAFDTGPANGPIDDWVRETTGATMDEGGALAAAGTVHEDVVTKLAANPFFDVVPPKSLDRLDFGIDAVRGLSAADGAATLTAFTAESVRLSVVHLPAPPSLWIVCGGGRKNPALMAQLRQRLPGVVMAAEEAGWRGDEIEAEAFAFLAVRSMRDLPLSLPRTTGVPQPCLGGEQYRP